LASVCTKLTLGFFLPPPIGILFVMIKPQVGIAVAIYWIFITWKLGHIKGIIKLLTPITLFYLITFKLYGFWLISNFEATQHFWNFSLWPLSIPIGFVLLVRAIKSNTKEYAFMASPFLSPYVAFHSYSVAILRVGTVRTDYVLSAKKRNR
jgi:hypothetical protein